MLPGRPVAPEADRSCDQAVNLLSDRPGTIEVVFVAHVLVGAALSREGPGSVEQALKEETKALAGEVREQVLGEHHPWHSSAGVGEWLKSWSPPPRSSTIITATRLLSASLWAAEPTCTTTGEDLSRRALSARTGSRSS